jgi:hypothetical protein
MQFGLQHPNFSLDCNSQTSPSQIIDSLKELITIVDYERLITNRLKQRFARDTIRVFFIGKIYGNE